MIHSLRRPTPPAVRTILTWLAADYRADRHTGWLPVRDATLAAALARLEACARLRDPTAAARVLDGLPAGDDGAWLLVQMAAAGLRALGTGTQQLSPAAVRHTPAGRRRSGHPASLDNVQAAQARLPARW